MTTFKRSGNPSKDSFESQQSQFYSSNSQLNQLLFQLVKRRNCQKNRSDFEKSYQSSFRNAIWQRADFVKVPGNILNQKLKITNHSRLKQIFRSLSLSCKDFIQQVELQKDRNTQLLQELLNQCDKFQELANFDKLNQSKQLILDFLDTLNIFEDTTESQLNSSSHFSSIQFQQQENSKLDKLIQLISNKTHYCSQEFLNEVRQKMQKLSLFFEQISFDKMNQDKKKAIRFSDLTDDKINSVNEYVEHLINMQNYVQYAQSVNNSNKIQKIKSIFDNKFNFISNSYHDSMMKYLIETYEAIYFDMQKLTKSNK